MANPQYSAAAAMISLAAVLGPGLGGCTATPRVNSELAYTLTTTDPSITETLQRLDRVQAQLEFIEALRGYYMPLILSARLLSTRVDRAYEQAVNHHEELAATVQRQREQIILSGSPIEPATLEQTDQWCKTTSDALCSLFELIQYAESHHSPPPNWTAPQGFEYVAVWK